MTPTLYRGQISVLGRFELLVQSGKTSAEAVQLLEAMYYGKPIFLSQHPALHEIGGDAAYYFRDFDPQSMRDVFDRGMTDFQSAGKPDLIRTQAFLFNWDRAALEYLRIYRQLETR